jgi:hypothetical protein
LGPSSQLGPEINSQACLCVLPNAGCPSLYKTIRPVVIYGAETWTPTSKNEKILMTWERKILRKICGPTKEKGQWRIKTNSELMTKYKSQDIVTKDSKIGMAWACY